MKWKSVLGAAALIACLIAAASVAWMKSRPATGLVWQGYADADYVKVGPTLAGALVSVSAVRGQTVAKGDRLFDQDDGDERAALDQAKRQLTQAEQVLANLSAGGKPTEIDQSKATLADLVAARDKAQADLERGEALLPHGAASAQSVDQLRADFKSAQAKVVGAQAALEQATAPLGRPREITAQEAAVGADRAAVVQAQWRLDQRHVTAPISGVVDETLALAGETLSAGAPVVSILAPENRLVRFFVPESDLPKVRLGAAVRLSCDGCDKALLGVVSFISPQAEYTPPVIYSETNRQKFVYLIEARAASGQTLDLHPGQPVDVSPMADANP